MKTYTVTFTARKSGGESHSTRVRFDFCPLKSALEQHAEIANKAAAKIWGKRHEYLKDSGIYGDFETSWGQLVREDRFGHHGEGQFRCEVME